MQVEKTWEDTKLIAKVEGRIDSNSASVLEQELWSDLDQAQALKLDFENVPYISSMGLRVLLKLYKKMKGAEGSMTICNVNDPVMEIFCITGFVDVLTIS